MIKNRIYENQKFVLSKPVINEIVIVWRRRVNPIVIGCFKIKKIIERIKLIIRRISENSL